MDQFNKKRTCISFEPLKAREKMTRSRFAFNVFYFFHPKGYVLHLSCIWMEKVKDIKGQRKDDIEQICLQERKRMDQEQSKVTTERGLPQSRCLA